MDEQIRNTIREMFPQLFRDNLNNFSGVFASTETHNGVNSPRIKPEDLLPYTSTSVTPLTTLPDGTFIMYDGFQNSFVAPSNYDYGFQLYLNGVWNKLNLADYYIIAQGQNSTQTINNGATATILFDSFVTQSFSLRNGTISVVSGSGTVTGIGTSFLSDFVVGSVINANGETHIVTAIATNISMTTDNWITTMGGLGYFGGFYNPVTGVWSMPSSSYYLVDALVTFSAGGVAGGTMTIKISSGPDTRTLVFPSSNTKETLHISSIMAMSPTGFSITVTNNSGAARTTTGTIDECVLTLKQLK